MSCTSEISECSYDPAGFSCEPAMDYRDPNAPFVFGTLHLSLSHKALLCNLLYHMVLIYLTHACTIMIDYICMYIILHI